MSGAVILMYHQVGPDAAPGREPGAEIYTVTKEAFASQLVTLRQSKCRVLPVEELAGQALRGEPLPERAAGITFDDGHASDYHYAFPGLNHLGFPATTFITPAWVNTAGYLRWDELKELASGMTVGAHGLDHTPLSSLGDDELRLHLREARGLLEARLGRPPTLLALPGGAGGRREVAVAIEEGFHFVFGSRPRRLGPGPTRDPLPRFAIRNTDSHAAFRGLVRQRALALARHSLRDRLASGLRRAVGEKLYARIRSRLIEEDSPS